MEIWTSVKGYEGYYEVNQDGDIRSNLRGIILKPNTARNYNSVHLHKDTVRHNHTIHRIVAKALIPNPDDKPCVNHIDGNPRNNKANNLEWVTYKENTQHALKLGLLNPCRGSKQGQSKLNEAKVLAIREMREWGSRNLVKGVNPFTFSWLARCFKVSDANISLVCTNKAWVTVTDYGHAQY